MQQVGGHKAVVKKVGNLSYCSHQAPMANESFLWYGSAFTSKKKEGEPNLRIHVYCVSVYEYVLC